jgi:hypothetical protein
VDSEEWRSQREKFLDQLHRLETGRISHWDENGSGELNRNTTDESVERVKQRLADLDARFTDESRA